MRFRWREKDSVVSSKLQSDYCTRYGTPSKMNVSHPKVQTKKWKILRCESLKSACAINIASPDESTEVKSTYREYLKCC